MIFVVSILFISLSAFYLESMLVADIRCIPFSTQLFKLKTKMGISTFTIIGNIRHVQTPIKVLVRNIVFLGCRNYKIKDPCSEFGPTQFFIVL